MKTINLLKTYIAGKSSLRHICALALTALLLAAGGGEAKALDYFDDNYTISVVGNTLQTPTTTQWFLLKSGNYYLYYTGSGWGATTSLQNKTTASDYANYLFCFSGTGSGTLKTASKHCLKYTSKFRRGSYTFTFSVDGTADSTFIFSKGLQISMTAGSGWLASTYYLTTSGSSISASSSSTSWSLIPVVSQSKIVVEDFPVAVGSTKTITPSENTSGGNVTYEIVSGGEYVTLNGSTLTGKAVGTAVIRASVAATTMFAASETTFKVQVTESAPVEKFVRVSGRNNIVNGAEYLIVYQSDESATVGYMLDGSQNGTSNGQSINSPFTLNGIDGTNHTVDVTNDLLNRTFVLNGTNGTYTVKSASGYYLNVGYDYPMLYSTSQKVNLVEVESENGFKIVNSDNSYYYLRYISNSFYSYNSDYASTFYLYARVWFGFPKNEYEAELDEGFVAPELLKSSSGLKFTYTSSDTSVAAVDSQTGTITLKKGGTTVITATYSGLSASYTLHVRGTVLTVTPSPVTAYPGEVIPLTAKTNNTDGGYTITYQSDNTSVATVDAAGRVTAVAAGTANITATISATANFTATTTTVPVTVSAVTSPTPYLRVSGLDQVVMGEEYLIVSQSGPDATSGQILNGNRGTASQTYEVGTTISTQHVITTYSGYAFTFGKPNDNASSPYFQIMQAGGSNLYLGLQGATGLYTTSANNLTVAVDGAQTEGYDISYTTPDGSVNYLGYQQDGVVPFVTTTTASAVYLYRKATPYSIDWGDAPYTSWGKTSITIDGVTATYPEQNIYLPTSNSLVGKADGTVIDVNAAMPDASFSCQASISGSTIQLNFSRAFSVVFPDGKPQDAEFTYDNASYGISQTSLTIDDWQTFSADMVSVTEVEGYKTPSASVVNSSAAAELQIVYQSLLPAPEVTVTPARLELYLGDTQEVTITLPSDYTQTYTAAMSGGTHATLNGVSAGVCSVTGVSEGRDTLVLTLPGQEGVYASSKVIIPVTVVNAYRYSLTFVNAPASGVKATLWNTSYLTSNDAIISGRSSVDASEVQVQYHPTYDATVSVSGQAITVTYTLRTPALGQFVRLKSYVTGTYAAVPAADDAAAVNSSATADMTNIFYYDNSGHLIFYPKAQYLYQTNHLAPVGTSTSALGQYAFALGSGAYSACYTVTDNVANSSLRSATVGTTSTGVAGNEDSYWTVEILDKLPITIPVMGYGYSTLCCPVALKCPESLSAYYVSAKTDGKTGGTATDYTLELTAFPDNIIPAGNPAILVGLAGATYNCELLYGQYDTEADRLGSGINLSGTVEALLTSSLEAGGTVFTLQPTDGAQSTGFYTWQSSVTGTYPQNIVSGFKCYFVESATGAAPGYRFVFSDPLDPHYATAIEEVQQESASESSDIYNLSGQKISASGRPASGLCVKDGKVIFVR